MNHRRRLAPPYAGGIRRRQALRQRQLTQTQLVTDHGVGDQYMRSTGGWAITLGAASVDPNGPTVASPSCAPWFLTAYWRPKQLEPFNTRAAEMLRLYDVIDRESMDDHFAREWKVSMPSPG